MVELLTVRDLQKLLQVDRSTIYRMADARKLPAIKVGKQWRFPADQVKEWLQNRATSAPVAVQAPAQAHLDNDLEALLPVASVQLFQDAFAEALGVMMVTTDMTGRPLTEPSHPCGLFKVIYQTPNAIQKCIQNWTHLEAIPGLEPRFIYSPLGLLGTRGLIRVGPALKGMVIAGGIAPADWPPPPEQVAKTAALFDLPPEALIPHINEVFYLEQVQQEQVLLLIQRIADSFAQLITDRAVLLQKLNGIASVVGD